MIEMETPPCLLCGGGQSTPVLAARDPDSLSTFVYHVVRCRDCDLQYVNPRPTPRDIGQFYPKEFYGGETWGLLARFFAGVRQRKLERVARRGRILDIGCGDGTFLLKMKSEGWDVFGIETSESGNKLSRQRLGENIRKEELTDARFPAAHFDAITLFGVIEHVHSPQAILKEIRRILKPGGALMMTTQNIDSLQADLSRGRWLHLDVPRHLIQFTPATLSAMLKRTGFEVIKHSTVFPEYNVPGMLQSLLNVILGDTNLLYKLVKGKQKDSTSFLRLTALVLLLPPVALASAVLEGMACLMGRGGAILIYAQRKE